ncbi:MAG: phosphatidylserine decarboxylase [Blastocatellia bacterium]|nr:phosphatidylserine decarboxylase [Blastocatellia bacterium]
MKEVRGSPPHQYIDRRTGRVCTERLFSDEIVRRLYAETREHAPAVFRLATSRRATELLSWLNYDLPLGGSLSGNAGFLRESGIDLAECLEPVDRARSMRRIFERKIRYWECRPMPDDEAVALSPADARLLVGSLADRSSLFLKGKFFDLEELLGRARPDWRAAFADGDYAIFRLTPDKYHYNHTPVAGVVRDLYEVRGSYHACNPSAVVTEVTPYSKNTRTVTILDTDVERGTRIGLVAMIEVTALMIGEVRQCYSRDRYDDPRPIAPGMFLERGRPKSLYRPGSSTDVLLFERGRIAFDEDLLRNQQRVDVRSRFSQGFGRPLVETEVDVRSRIAARTE